MERKPDCANGISKILNKNTKKLGRSYQINENGKKKP